MKKKDQYMAGFAARFNKALDEKGLLSTQLRGKSKNNEEIGKRYGISGQMVGYLRSGTRQASTATALLIAQDLGVNFEWLMTGQGPKHPPSQAEQSLLERIQSLNEQERAALDVFLPKGRTPYKPPPNANDKLIQALESLTPERREVIELLLSAPTPSKELKNKIQSDSD